jgi:two-component system, chemotaxis family, sensor kinase Cph1
MASQVDLTTCDRQAIHLIGAVQPHGGLIAISADTMIAQYASTNIADFVGLPPEALLGRPISDLLGAENVAQLLNLSLEPSTPELLKPWFIKIADAGGAVINLECLPHRNDGHIILEFMRPELNPAPLWEDELLRQGIISELVKPGALIELADASAKMIRDVTGFDRVMIYKFAEDKHGEVIAESTNRPDSFLGLHYPASDIPDPARRHFALNVMRSIPDINGAHINIIGQAGDVADESAKRPLDLTFSKLRAVAPVHVEYLNNMGVGASLSISLLTNGALWGLVACHHYSTRLISSSRLRFAELLGGITSALLQSIENTNQLQKSITAEKSAFNIEQQARDGKPLKDLVVAHADDLMQLIDAQGLYLMLGGELISAGVVPKTGPDYSYLRARLDDGIAVSSTLSEFIEIDEEQLRLSAGAALLNLSDDGEDYLVLLRSEFDQTISWAGKPEKIESKTKDGSTRLSPRGSFALWQEERRGQSRSFDALDRDALRIVRRALFALNSLEREQAALAAQKVAETKELRLRHALLDAARASSMGELASAIAHELNQPLSAVSNYVNACRQELINAGVDVPERVEYYIEQAAKETARAGELIYRIRNFISYGDLNVDLIDLNDAIRQGVDLAIVASDLPNLKVDMVLDHSLPRVLADRVQITQVVLNLARNSIVAMEQSAEQLLTVEVTRTAQHVLVAVRDTGCGIPVDLQEYLFEPFHASTTMGMGIGLSLCRSILEAHSGKIWVEPSSQGAALIFQLPLQEDQNDRLV